MSLGSDLSRGWFERYSSGDLPPAYFFEDYAERYREGARRLKDAYHRLYDEVKGLRDLRVVETLETVSAVGDARRETARECCRLACNYCAGREFMAVRYDPAGNVFRHHLYGNSSCTCGATGIRHEFALGAEDVIAET